MALQLLSDKEKNDIAHLVSTMVSYAITYKKMKSDTLPNTLKYEVADELALSLFPAIGNFVNFKVWTWDYCSCFYHGNLSQLLMFILLSTSLQDYTSNHYVLSLAMKQVLVHEVRLHKLKCLILVTYYIFSFSSLFKEDPNISHLFSLVT